MSYDLESITALNMALEDREKLSAEESERNIRDNIVNILILDSLIVEGGEKVTLNTKAIAHGLQITTDGFILTAYHNMRDFEKNQKNYVVYDQNFTAYNLDPRFLVCSPKHDLVVIKAIKEDKPKAIYFLVAKDDLFRGQKIKLHHKDENNLYSLEGEVTAESCNIGINNGGERIEHTTYDSFVTNISGFERLSGAPFITDKGEFAGLALCTLKQDYQICTAGGKVRIIRELVKQTAYALGKHHFSK